MREGKREILPKTSLAALKQNIIKNILFVLDRSPRENHISSAPPPPLYNYSKYLYIYKYMQLIE